MNDDRMMDTTKLCFHKDRIQQYFNRGERVAPVHIDAGIAKFCNVRCVFCYGKYQDLKPVYIQRDALLQTIRDAEAIGVKSLAFIGDGEPTCNPALYQALVLGAQVGLDMAVSTNGVLVDSEAKCQLMLDSCKWMRFCISAGTREGYKKIHGVDKFEEAIRNIQQMVQTKYRFQRACDVGMQAVYVPGLMDADMIEESKLAVRLGVDYFVIKQCSIPDNGESGMALFDVNAYDAQSTIETLKTCEMLSTDKTKIIVKWDTIKRKGARPYNGCPSIPFISEMSGNGDWFPCGHMFGDKPRFAKYKFGNVHEKSLREIYESDHYWEVLRMMRDEFDCHTQCKGACRQDATNEFCDRYLENPTSIQWRTDTDKVKGINFI
jgi:MoaA/NifB/PqqE/SkfB family radical SAM enzyme